MTSADGWRRSSRELAAAYAEGSSTPTEVVESVIEHAARVDGRLNIFAHRAFDAARAQAEQSTRRWRRGEPLGPYDGVPITVKDNIPVAGMPCEWGSRVFEGRLAQRDELCVARLRERGWVILGKTNVSEFTLGRGNVSTPLHGTTRNPWAPALTTGASTGGSAAAVASGVGPAALGTDGGGSIRWPAGYCGLVGLKPSLGRVPRVDGLPVVLHDLEVAAPLARSVADVEALLQAMAGPDPRDRASHLLAAPAEADRALRIRYVPQFGEHPVDPEITASVNTVAERLRALGHEVDTGPAPHDVARFDAHWPTIGTAGLAWLLRDHDGWRDVVADIYPPMVAQGSSASAIDYVAALNAFRELYLELAEFFRTADLLLTPVAGAMPWPAEQLAPPHQRVFTGIANATGVPAISLPGPASPQGLPIGFQLIAAFGADQLLLRLAAQYELAYPWADRWPSPTPPTAED
ncbi:amidase [Dactylosporangium sp. NPDC051485]|uniref:amidase n=1 Tax=Dactylosporangium sp. NPDC051485 TaxID=3154846 RepID=UPI00341D2F18